MKYSVKTVALLTVGLCSGLAMNCPSANAQSSAKKVDFIFTGYAYPYFAPMAKAIREVSTYYPDITIKIIDAGNSPSTQISDIKEAVADNVGGIILNPVDGAVTSAAQQAMAGGIPIVTIDRDVAAPSARDIFIGDDDVQLGQIQTKYALQYLAAQNIPKPWHVAVLQGTLGASVSIGRLQGEMDELKPYVDNGTVKIVLNQSADFATDKAQAMVTELLAKDSQLKLIVAANDAMALGAILAVKNQGLTPGKDIFIVGADAQPESLSAVKQGGQLDTVTHSPFVEAFWSVEAMDNLLQSKTLPPAGQFPNSTIIIPMDLVTTANVDKISTWGTPEQVPALPYGTSSAHNTTP